MTQVSCNMLFLCKLTDKDQSFLFFFWANCAGIALKYRLGYVRLYILVLSLYILHSEKLVVVVLLFCFTSMVNICVHVGTVS